MRLSQLATSFLAKTVPLEGAHLRTLSALVTSKSRLNSCVLTCPRTITSHSNSWILMGKRRASDDDYASDVGAISSDSHYSPDAESSNANKSKKKTRRAPAKKRAKASVASDDEVEPATLTANPHPASLHRITDAKPIRAALLKWYAGVHEIRGMPWRKVYDPSLGPEERGQRAYEVSLLSQAVAYCNEINTIRRCGYPKSCCSRLRSRQ